MPVKIVKQVNHMRVLIRASLRRLLVLKVRIRGKWKSRKIRGLVKTDLLEKISSPLEFLGFVENAESSRTIRLHRKVPDRFLIFWKNILHSHLQCHLFHEVEVLASTTPLAVMRENCNWVRWTNWPLIGHNTGLWLVETPKMKASYGSKLIKQL